MLSIEKFESAPCIFIYRNAFDCGNFIELIEKEANRSWPYLSWNRSETGGIPNQAGLISEYRTSLEMSLQPLTLEEVNDELQELQTILIEHIFKPIDLCIYDYRNCFDLPLKADTGYALLKYSGGSEYHIHHDHGPENERVLSLVACLGEDEFSGGELEFNNFNLTIKLNKNDLVLFPSNFPYTHIAHPVDSGTKYSLVTWFI